MACPVGGHLAALRAPRKGLTAHSAASSLAGHHRAGPEGRGGRERTGGEGSEGGRGREEEMPRGRLPSFHKQ